MGHLGGDVDVVGDPAATASRYSPKDCHSQLRPSCRAAPGMSSTPSISSMRRSWSLGTHRCEADPAVAHHHGGDAVPRRRGEVVVPGGLAVVVGVDVDEAGGDQGAVGVDLRAPAPSDNRADRDDAVVDHGDVGTARPVPVPSMTVPPRMTRS